MWNILETSPYHVLEVQEVFSLLCHTWDIKDNNYHYYVKPMISIERVSIHCFVCTVLTLNEIREKVILQLITKVFFHKSYKITLSLII